MHIEAESSSVGQRTQVPSIERLNREIRRAANSFLGITELLLETGLTREQREYVEVLRTATDRLISIGGRIVRISGGDVDESHCYVNFDLCEMLEQTADIMRILAAEHGVHISTNIGNAAQWPVAADRPRLEQVLVSVMPGLLNLGSPGHMRVVATPLDANCVRFEFTAPPNAAAGSDSTGDTLAELSLEVAAQTIRLMGGEFAMGTLDQHIVASFTIPLGNGFDEHSVGSARSMQPAPCSFTAVRILLAEDSPDNQFLIRAYLKDQAYAVDIVDSGIAAVDRAKSGEYSIILMDIEMPGMSGMEATKAIRAWEGRAGRLAIPIIALTAHSDPDDMNSCLAQGFTAYLPKPVRKQTVLTTLQRYLQHGKV